MLGSQQEVAMLIHPWTVQKSYCTVRTLELCKWSYRKTMRGWQSLMLTLGCLYLSRIAIIDEHFRLSCNSCMTVTQSFNSDGLYPISVCIFLLCIHTQQIELASHSRWTRGTIGIEQIYIIPRDWCVDQGSAWQQTPPRPQQVMARSEASDSPTSSAQQGSFPGTPVRGYDTSIRINT